MNFTSIPKPHGMAYINKHQTLVIASNYSKNLVVLDGSFKERLGYEISRG